MIPTFNSNNHLSHLLAKWYPNRDIADWVLAVIYDTEGPCYRKAGAIMLFSSQGEQLGMLSGGCLESDIATNARKVMQTGQAISLCYDGSDEDDLSFQLGIGCGGTVYIMLQKIDASNNYLALTQVYDALKLRQSGYYYLPLIKHNALSNLNPTQPSSIDCDNPITAPTQAYFDVKLINDLASHATIDADETWLANPVIPEPHLLIVGGGIDAHPLVNMAKQLGWQVSLWDPRPANARKEFFSHVNHLIKGEAKVLTDFAFEKKINAAVLMSHNVLIDAQALQALAITKIKYLALLGPENRREQVIAQAKYLQNNNLDININFSALHFAGPAGLDIGGTLPESIALSILSECHAVLFDRKAQSMSNFI